MRNVLEPRFPKNYRFYYLNVMYHTYYRLINRNLGAKKARALGTPPHPRKRSRCTGERPAAGAQRRLHGFSALTASKAAHRARATGSPGRSPRTRDRGRRPLTAHARPGPRAAHRARASRAPGRSPRRPAQHGGVRQQKRKRPRWKASARPGSGAYSCSRKASGRPHCAQASPAGPGSPAAPSHAGRPPTLLGNCSLRSRHAGAASTKPSSASPTLAAAMGAGSRPLRLPPRCRKRKSAWKRSGRRSRRDWTAVGRGRGHGEARRGPASLSLTSDWLLGQGREAA